jgi:hypothetical protein
MTRTLERFVLTLSLFCALALPACGGKDDAGTKKGTADHDHGPPPNKGEVLELGNEEGHLEVMHDHKDGHITVWVYGPSWEKPLHVERPVVMIQTKEGPKEVTLAAVNAKPDGTAHQWKAQHDGLKVDPWDGRITVKFDGKTFQSPLENPEGEGHSHK